MKKFLALASLAVVLGVTALAQISSAKGADCKGCCGDKCGQSCCPDGCKGDCCK